ncbi:MAG: tetratricopeptide repeat protein [Burkholderiaceae bacterium]|nr:tetratricopeptide repeat protein [Burkholderiales bacterium]TAL65394.1 MAG: tetratricopeptide repeat protein [Burkholderiaceae bacterium]TBR74935.1 MAG: tetratricopeptide repeat protein [Burkholderiaceae bacterium]
MATPLDLQEQEQLEELKHFWKKYGNLITWVLLIVFGALAAWNVYNYWQRGQAVKASVLYDSVESAAESGDMTLLARSFDDMKSRFGRTTYAQQSGLLVAKTLDAKGNIEGAKAALAWVADHASDEGYQAIAKLRLAAVLMELKAYDEARKQLEGSFPAQFAPLVADRLGDIDVLQGKKAEAVVEYRKAYQGLDPQLQYRRMVEVKLNALGVDPQAATPAAGGSQ